MIEVDRLITALPSSSHEEVLERALRPKQLQEYIGQEKIREQLQIFIDAAKNAMKHSIMYCCLVRQDSAKPHLRILSRKRWGLTYGKHLVRFWSALAIWRLC